MKRNLFIITIVLATLLIETFLIGNVIAQDTKITVDSPTILESLLAFLRGNQLTFTIVGVDVGASVTADYTWDNIAPGTNFNHLASEKCSSGHGLFDVYANNYVPRFEMKDNAIFTCGSTNSKCIVELYCMNKDFCTSDSSCGSGYQCLTKTATDPYMPLKTSSGTTINSYNYCKASSGCTGQSKTCYRVSSSNPLTCESSVYSCSYPTYQEIINTNCASGAGSFIYSSSSSCSVNTCTPDNSGASNVCTGSSFTNNCNQVISGTKVCGTSCPEGKTLCSDGVCKTDCSTPTGAANFKVTILSAAPSVFTSEKDVSVLVKIKNNGGTGSMKVEVGLYKATDINDWGFVISQEATNCEPTEKNVETKLITLDAGEETTQTFTITTPKVCREVLETVSDFDILALSYLNCKNTGLANGVTSSSRFNILFTPRNDCTGSCSNGINDGEETDTDCGGSQCSKCQEGWKCNKVTDCQSGLACTNGYCSNYEASGNIVSKKSMSMTEEAFVTATDESISESMCKRVQDCSPTDILTDESVNVEDYNWTVKCITSASIKESNKLAIEEYLKKQGANFDAGFYEAVCKNSGFLSSLEKLSGFFTGIDDCKSYIEDVPSGTCRASVKASVTGFCIPSANSWLSSLTKSTDCQTNTLMLIGLILAIIIILSIVISGNKK